jgi:hypothetical protein
MFSTGCGEVLSQKPGVLFSREDAEGQRHKEILGIYIHAMKAEWKEYLGILVTQRRKGAKTQRKLTPRSFASLPLSALQRGG